MGSSARAARAATGTRARYLVVMCGRFSLQTPVPDLAELFEADARSVQARDARFNIAPTEDVLIVRPSDEGRRLAGVRWGLIPNWAKAPGDLPLMINARAETLEIKPAFRDLIPDRRCAVLADGFFEWRKERGLKQPYFVRRRDRMPLAFAGLWDRWRGPEGPIESCSIVTTEANHLLEPLHHRMPVILDEPGQQLWLGSEISADTLDPLVPCEDDLLEVIPVSTRVNGIALDDSDCVEPIGATIRVSKAWADRPPVGDAPESQLGLF